MTMSSDDVVSIIFLALVGMALIASICPEREEDCRCDDVDHRFRVHCKEDFHEETPKDGREKEGDAEQK